MNAFRMALAAGFTLILTAGAADAALAQARPGGGMPVSPQQATGGAIGRETVGQQQWRYESEEQRLQREAESREEAETRYGAERLDLADRVQALMDQGQCREARALANAEGDRNMALRVRQLCRARR